MIFIDIIENKNLYTVRYLKDNTKEIKSGEIDILEDRENQNFLYKLFSAVTNEEVYMWDIPSAKKLYKIGSLLNKNLPIEEIFLVEPYEKQIRDLKKFDVFEHIKLEEVEPEMDKLIYMNNLASLDTKELYESYVALEAQDLIVKYLENFNSKKDSGEAMINNIYNSMKYYYNEVQNSSFKNENRITYNLLSIMNEEDLDEEDLDLAKIPF